MACPAPNTADTLRILRNSGLGNNAETNASCTMRSMSPSRFG